MARSAIPLGATGRTVAANVHRLRKAKGMSVRALAAALNELGRPITGSGVTRLEGIAEFAAPNPRRIDVDDLVALAQVFDVSPSVLLLPLDDDPAHKVEVTGAGMVAANQAWDWMDGRSRLDQPTADLDTAALEFALYSRPPIRRNREIGRGHG